MLCCGTLIENILRYVLIEFGRNSGLCGLDAVNGAPIGVCVSCVCCVVHSGILVSGHGCSSVDVCKRFVESWIVCEPGLESDVDGSL